MADDSCPLSKTRGCFKRNIDKLTAGKNIVHGCFDKLDGRKVCEVTLTEDMVKTGGTDRLGNQDRISLIETSCVECDPERSKNSSKADYEKYVSDDTCQISDAVPCRIRNTLDNKLTTPQKIEGCFLRTTGEVCEVTLSAAELGSEDDQVDEQAKKIRSTCVQCKEGALTKAQNEALGNAAIANGFFCAFITALLLL